MHKGSRKIVLVVQVWHRGYSDLAMDAMVAVKFWECSKQSPRKGRRGGRSFTFAQRMQEEGTRIAVVAEWMHLGRPLVAPLKMRTVAHIIYEFGRRFCLPCTTIVPPLTKSAHWAITVASTVPPFGDYGNPWDTMAMVLASTLPPLRGLLCHCGRFGGSGNAQGSCCSS